MVLDNLKQRIVAEAVVAARLEEDSPAAGCFALGLNLARRIGHGDVADELGGTLL